MVVVVSYIFEKFIQDWMGESNLDLIADISNDAAVHGCMLPNDHGDHSQYLNTPSLSKIEQNVGV